MKTKFTFLLSLIVCVATQSFAGLTLDVPYSQNPSITTPQITGTYTNSTSNTYDNLWLYEANLTCSGKNLVVGTTNSAGLTVGGGTYIVAVEGNSSLTIKDGASFIIYSSASFGIINGADEFTLTIESTANKFRAHKLFSNAKTTTLNLWKEYGISEKKMTVGVAGGQRELVINMNCNQSFALDSRANSIYSVNITNDALFTVTGVSLLNDDSGTVTFKIENGLLDGSMMFLTDDSFYSNTYLWSESDSKLTINSGSKKQIASFVDVDGNALQNLKWEAVDGGYKLYGVAVPEPAEWAMILGALALCLAIYRRRK
ncbi:MAG: hypothetical protein IJF70_04225 [Opitutales bacterium]|nr:hypothetical protein [Opitutales bacterium]